MSSVVTKIEPDRRLQIPAEWGDEFAPEHEVELVRCEEGILVKPLRWQHVNAIRQGLAATGSDYSNSTQLIREDRDR